MKLVYNAKQDSVSLRCQHCNNDDDYHDQPDYRPDAQALFGAVVVLLGLYQLLLCVSHIILAAIHIALDTVDILPLSHHQSRQLIKQRYTLIHGPLENLDVSEFVLDIADSVFEGDTGLSENSFLKHLLSRIRIIYVPLQLIILNVWVVEPHLPCDLCLHHILIFRLGGLLLFKGVPHFLADIGMEVLFHSRLRLVRRLFCGSLDLFLDNGHLFLYFFVNDRVLAEDGVHLGAAFLLDGGLARFGILILANMCAFAVAFQICNHCFNILDFLKELLLHALLPLLSQGRPQFHPVLRIMIVRFEIRQLYITPFYLMEVPQSINHSNILYNVQMPNINMQSTHIKHEEETIEMHCDICLTDYTFHKNEKLRPVSICYACWSNHIRTFLTRISYQVGNPILAVGEGEEPIDVCEAINSLKDDERNELEEWLFKKYTTFTPDIEKCPSETCDFVFTMEKCRWRANQELCPKCETKLSTDNKLQIRSVAGIIYFILIANKCPKCEIPIEKTSGCPHMTCPCGHQFCWFCLKDHHQNGRNLYAVHEAKECFSVVVSKVLILMMCLTSLIIACSGNDSSKGLFSILIYCVVGFLKALLLNFVLAINVVTVNHFFYIYKYRWNKKAFAVGLGLLLCMDLAFLLGLNYCDLLEDILSIFFFEVTLVAIGGAQFWIGYHLYETWFEYIA